MNNNIKNVCIFLAGAAIGTAATWKYFKTKYEQIAKEEIASVKETFAKKTAAKQEDKETPEKDINPEMETCKNVIQEMGYNPSNIDNDGNSANGNGIYVIPPESVGESDYDITTLTYYSDGVLTDDADEIVRNIDELIGVESLNHFGEFEDDSVHVRNDRLKIDFEILRDMRCYANVISKSAHPIEDDQCEIE